MEQQDRARAGSAGCADGGPGPGRRGPISQLRILLIEDNPGDARLIQEMLNDEKLGQTQLTIAGRMDEALSCLGESGFDVVLTDLGLPDSVGLSSVLRIVECAPEMPIVVLTGMSDEDAGVQALHAGAQDYLAKGDVHGELLLRAIRYAIERKGAEKELKQANQQLHEAYDELQQSQAQLVQLEKMSAVGTLAAGVAHELNNPMMGILNFAQYCLKHTQDDTRVHSVLEDIEREAKRCAEIVNDLLRFTRMDRDDTDAFELEDLSVIIDRILRLMSFRIERGSITVERCIAPDVPPIRMRPNQIQQALLDLLSNALAAVADRPERRVSIDAQCSDEMASIRITDSGHGITPEHLPRIFDPFFTTRPVGQGTGLGLPICRSIIENHGGTITCESTVGRGTTFNVKLPIAQQQTGEEHAQTSVGH